MRIYFAPMQGITDAPYRAAHAARFSGVDKYFMPFISPTQHTNLTNKELRDVSPEANAGLSAVPQILTRDAEHFLFAARLLYDMGWEEINLNMGCPAGTVTAKGKGAGMLVSLDRLALFLDEIYTSSPLPVSIKTRIGWSSPDEFPAILSLLNQYPVRELIVHARTRAQLYGGHPCEDAFAYAVRHTCMPLIYNGDLFSVRDARAFAARYPDLPGIMIGRGLASDPALARTFKGGALLSAQDLRAWHAVLYDLYTERFAPDAALGRMRELGKHTICCFAGAAKPMKAVRKARSLAAYREAMDWLFDHCALRESPGFLSDGSAGGHAAAEVSPDFC